MKMGRMAGWVFAVGLAGCAGSPQGMQAGAIEAGPQARAYGVGSYVATDEGLRLYDRDGIEIGHVVMTADTTHRLMAFEMADGDAPEVEVDQPAGRFVASPLKIKAMTLAVAGDPALAPLIRERLDVRFDVVGLTANSAHAPRELAPATCRTTTTACSTPTSTTPLGCARPANTSVGCTNVSQLPAQVTGSRFSGADYYYYYGDMVNDYYASYGCYMACQGASYVYTDSYSCYCGPAFWYSENTWTASCPAQTCTTSGQYDAVPRNKYCYENPDSCTNYQGTVGCTPYH